ncbi:hypothetical protein ACNRWW_13880 [Metabacillus sp. HB246100]
MAKKVKVTVINVGKPDTKLLAKKLLELSYKYIDKKEEQTIAV